MRFFPRTARRRMAAAVAAAAVALGAVSVPYASADDLKHKQKSVERKVDHAHDDLDESSRQLSRATARLDAAQASLADAKSKLAIAQGRLTVAQERDAAMQAELETAEAELTTAEADLVAGREELGTQRHQVASTISDIYMQGDPELLAFASMLKSETTADLTRRAEVRNVVVGRETRAYDQLHAAEVLLEVRRKQVSDARDIVADKRAEAADHLVVMQGLEQEAESAKSSVRALVGERASARAEARVARAADLKKLQKLEREADRIQEMLRKRALRALRRAQSHARSGPTGGYLDYPTGGPITSPFGYRVHPIYGYWGLHDGADFGPGCGAPIRAAAPGRVISSYYSSVYGRRLIIDHGAVSGVGLATIYNHATSYTVGVGAQVERGQVIGYVGNSGWSTGCHLHFTVMANGQAVDPENWL